MIAALFIGAAMAAVVAWIFATAPEGYEDSTGFNHGAEPFTAPRGHDVRAPGADLNSFHGNPNRPGGPA